MASNFQNKTMKSASIVYGREIRLKSMIFVLLVGFNFLVPAALAGDKSCIAPEKLSPKVNDFKKEEENISIEIFAWYITEYKRYSKFVLKTDGHSTFASSFIYKKIRERFKSNGLEFLENLGEIQEVKIKHQSLTIPVLSMNRICWMAPDRVIVFGSSHTGNVGGDSIRFELEKKKGKWSIKSFQTLGIA